MMIIREDLVAQGLSVPIQFLDDGMNMIITINDPDRWWLANREAFAYSIDFGWN